MVMGKAIRATVRIRINKSSLLQSEYLVIVVVGMLKYCILCEQTSVTLGLYHSIRGV